VVIGQGTYGVVNKASYDDGGEESPPLVAKRARGDALSKKYLNVEGLVNQLVKDRLAARAAGGGAPPIANFVGRSAQQDCLVWEDAGARSLDAYLREGACGMDLLAAAVSLDDWCDVEDASCVLDEEGLCSVSDPEFARGGRTNVVVAAEVLARLLEGLTALHAVGVAHRDVKPANVLVDVARGRLTLCDLGSAVDASAGRVGDSENRPRRRAAPVCARAASARPPAPPHRRVQVWRDGRGRRFETVARLTSALRPGAVHRRGALARL
jgi:serine/threonine protein kinase